MLSEYFRVMDRSRGREYTTPEVQHVRADFARTELDVAFTFLDIAANTRDQSHARKCVQTATDALRTADRFFAQTEVSTADIREFNEDRERLRKRLREIAPEPELEL